MELCCLLQIIKYGETPSYGLSGDQAFVPQVKKNLELVLY